MTLTFPNTATIKQYVPGVYFIVLFTWMAFQDQNPWILLVILPFVIQLIFNNKYINLSLGFISIVGSFYMAIPIFNEMNLKILAIALVIAIANLYMSRMLFLNQNFTAATFRENSLDETLFL